MEILHAPFKQAVNKNPSSNSGKGYRLFYQYLLRINVCKSFHSILINHKMGNGLFRIVYTEQKESTDIHRVAEVVRGGVTIVI